MYSELFDQLGGGNGRLGRNASNESNTAADNFLVSFTAGKMNLTSSENSSGTFDCVPNKTRGQVQLLVKDGSLRWQWYDRRERAVVDDFAVTNGGTWEKVEDGPAAPARVYVWTTTQGGGDAPKYNMYWMQSADDSAEEETMAKVRSYLADPSSAIPEAAPEQAAAAAHAQADGAQVDALSRILENLGMPPAENNNSAAPETAAAAESSNPDPPAAGTNTLTLADLQGAMAGLQQQQHPPLDMVVTQQAIADILADPAACERLREFLPPTQQEMLQENLQSPSIRQTLRSLSATVTDNLPSVLANFQLPSNDAIAAGTHPLQGFLEALEKSVKEQDKEEEKDEDGDAKMEEEKE